MRGVQLAQLLDGDRPGVAEALDLVAGFDDALVHGFARLGEERAAGLAALAGAMATSPLGPAVSEAADKVAAGSIGAEHLTALAGARIALLGAVHDALLDRLDTALGRTRAAWDEAPATAAPADNLLSGSRSWLHELAIAGWRGVDHDLVSSSDQTLEALLAEPGLRRLAVLLDGLAAELRASCPIATMARLPVRRWADLWTRAVLLSQPGARPTASVAPVTGRLLPLGVDVHEHGTAVQAQVHGVLELAGGGPSRLVRASVAAAKVDTIVGPAVWRLLDAHPVLLSALAERRSLDLTDMPLTSGGDLVWQDDKASAGAPADPFATARVQLANAHASATPPLERHPIRICEPVLLEDYETDGDRWTLDGHPLTVDLARLPAAGPLTPELLAASSSCIGLMRWDAGRWRVQPLAVRATVKRKPVEAHTGDWAQGPTDPKVVKAEAKAGDAVAVLRERAGRLLRK
ncbi:hypothetical protein SMC26_28855 [Actinomadura fulvescens]|uniref:DUF222 domain-containing protein n=1 Tax=Actinomadura fulvescens TaxID=46160 RepID=A0ABN3Q0W4_9ACTN